MLDVAEYKRWASEHRAEIELATRQRDEATCSSVLYKELLKPYVPATLSKAAGTDASELQIEGVRVKAQIPGRCFRCDVVNGRTVEEGKSLVGATLIRFAPCICARLVNLLAKAAQLRCGSSQTRWRSRLPRQSKECAKRPW
jgi:urea carboxylase / allophanate hydrolase